jgi:hypothetical protein
LIRRASPVPFALGLSFDKLRMTGLKGLRQAQPERAAGCVSA